MARNFPRFPKKDDIVKFNKSWNFRDSNYDLKTIPNGTLGQVLDTEVIPGSEFHVASGFLLYIGVDLDNEIYFLKFPYEDSSILSIIPNTPASKVLYGNETR